MFRHFESWMAYIFKVQNFEIPTGEMIGTKTGKIRNDINSLSASFSQKKSTWPMGTPLELELQAFKSIRITEWTCPFAHSNLFRYHRCIVCIIAQYWVQIMAKFLFKYAKSISNYHEKKTSLNGKPQFFPQGLIAFIFIYKKNIRLLLNKWLLRYRCSSFISITCGYFLFTWLKHCVVPIYL